MLRNSLRLILSFCLLLHTAVAQKANPIQFADPTIFEHKGTWYLYGTGESAGEGGFKVYTSNDTKNWVDRGAVLKKGESFGTKGFWAPQVFEYRKKFYMAYVADENIAIAESDSPLGPFKQREKKAISAPVRMIDPFVFFDQGKVYLYHVRLDQGNRIFVAEMKNDLSGIKEETLKACISATDAWEDTQKVSWKVTEGPTVLKRDHTYYLFYSANDYRNPDYAVGYATSNTPIGPWKKYQHNPIISRSQTQVNGSGHGDFFSDSEGKLTYVFHTHESNAEVGKRKTAMITAAFVKDKDGKDVLKVDSKSFRYLLEK